MNCPICGAGKTSACTQKTSLGCRTCRCLACKRRFNERTSTPFKHLPVPPALVLLVVLWRLRYQLRLREFAAMFRARGFACTPEAVRDWAARFAPLITPQLRAQRKGQTGRSWHVDAMYLKVAGQGHSL